MARLCHRSTQGPQFLRDRSTCASAETAYSGGVEGNPASPHQSETTEIDANRLNAIRMCLDAAREVSAFDALPHLREAADWLASLLDETMAAAVLSGQASLRSAGHQAGLTENTVGPRLARTQALGAYADARGRVTATGIERAKYDHESGTPRPAPETTTTMRFTPRRSTP